MRYASSQRGFNRRKKKTKETRNLFFLYFQGMKRKMKKCKVLGGARFFDE